MKRLAASALAIAATLCELAAAVLWALHAVVTWEPPNAFEEWAEGEGRPALASLERGGDGLA